MTAVLTEAPSHRRREAAAPLRRNTAAVLAIALSLRLLVCAFALQHFGAAWFFNRGTEVGFVARSLLTGHGIASPFGPPTGPTALIAPGYPLFVAAVFRCFGMFTVSSAAVLMAVNALLNTTSILLVLGLARRFAGERAAVLAALLPACAPPLLWMPSIFWETSFSAALLLGCVALAAQLGPRTSGPRWLAAGALLGFAGLVNPALLPALFAAGFVAASGAKRTTIRKPALALLGFALVFAAWPLRNARVLHAFVPTRTTVGFELWMGNRDGATGYLDESRFPTFNRGELDRYNALGEVGYMAGKMSLAKIWIQAHPGAFLKLTASRIGRFWSGTGTQHGSLAYPLYAALTTLGAAMGVGLSWRRRAGRRLLLCLLAAALLFPLPYYLTHAEFRYRLVLDPVLCVLSAAAIERLLSLRRQSAPS